MIGMQAAEMLSRRIKSSTDDVRQVRLPAKLVIRRSCGCGGH
jgi:LacI family transcriptional regulator